MVGNSAVSSAAMVVVVAISESDETIAEETIFLRVRINDIMKGSIILDVNNSLNVNNSCLE